MPPLTLVRCPTQKKCFRTPFEARPYLESLRAAEHPQRAAKLSTYRCRDCGWFHIGHNFGPVSQRTARRGKHARPKKSLTSSKT